MSAELADLAAHIREVAAVRPGDVLVVTFDPATDGDEFQDYMDQLKVAMPDWLQVVGVSNVALHIIRKEPDPAVTS